MATTNTGSTNTFVSLVSAPYGFSGAARYNQSDVPANWASNNALSPEQLTSKLAYEWLNSHEISGADANPPFTSGAAGRLIPGLNAGQRIIRGYIRRANYEAGDATSKSRLYFMYNPENIVRDYVSYLDQAALDPFNTVFGSGNLVAPPSFMNFRFELFFDRQDEVSVDKDHPGVFVDYQFFDLVVRNVVPSDPNSVSTSIPDNGVMMVNPRDITVVFSPQLTVQGRPINAQVVFEKFSHRMTPIRMRIALEMRVSYIGPMREFSEYRMETYSNDTSASVAPDDTVEFTFTNSDLIVGLGANAGAAAYQPGADPSVQSGLNGVSGLSDPSNANIRQAALRQAIAYVDSRTEYTRTRRGAGVGPSGKLRYVDCSSLVWHAYNGIGMTAKMGWGGSSSAPADSRGMIASFPKNKMLRVASWAGAASRAQAANWLADADNRAKIQPGDLLFRDANAEGLPVGHVAIFMGWSADGSQFTVFEAANSNPGGVGQRSHPRQYMVNDLNHIMRPVPLGSNSYASPTLNTPYVRTA